MRLLVLWAVLLGLVVPLFGGSPVLAMIASKKSLYIIATLVIVMLMMVLQNKESLFGEDKATLSWDIWM